MVMTTIMKRKGGVYASLLVLVVAATSAPTSLAFLPSKTSWRQPTSAVVVQPLLPSKSQLAFFGRGDKDSKEADQVKSDDDDEKGKVPFFGRFGRKEEAKAEAATTTVTTAAPQQKPAAATATVDQTPAERAASLRAQAAKARLEAERMDAELTLRKIERLEKELLHAKKSSSDSNSNSSKSSGPSVEDLQREMEMLQRKMMGDDDAPVPVAAAVVAPKKAATSAPEATPAVAAPSMVDVVATLAPELKQVQDSVSSAVIEPFEEKNFQEIKDMMEESPTFVLKTVATQVGLNFDSVDDINKTELALRVDKMNRLDFSYSNLPKPTFSATEIDEKREELTAMQKMNLVDKRLIDGAKGNETALAILALEQDYYSGINAEMTEGDFSKILEGEDWLQPVMEIINKTAVDSAIETLYPKCMRKEGQAPTMAQAQMLLTDVLTKTTFASNSRPEPVQGGFIIRGKNTAENGDTLIEAIDKELAKSSLGEKMTVLYMPDFTIFATDDIDSIDLDEPGTILYVTGPDIAREPSRVLLSIVSAAGIASSWYLSVYPFLLNPTLSQRVEQDMALVDANMAPDLSWLTDLSIPLFYTFFGIQILHDIAHRVVAETYGMQTRAPTYVPSIITGITSSVTTFKEPPKNNQAMFDYSVAGPLVGMLASLGAIAVGAQLTLSGDASVFPSLPLEILRQSTLGGGIIDSILGNGALSVPEAALGTSAVAGMTIPLHPVVVAGYISLVVNALAVLPIGTTDGGRMGLALFGRGPKLVVGNVFLFAILFVGLGGSDLFLFYFAFCLACQAGNEIPARNEVDTVDFSRIGVATVTYILALLALIPFQ